MCWWWLGLQRGNSSISLKSQKSSIQLSNRISFFAKKIHPIISLGSSTPDLTNNHGNRLHHPKSV